MTTQKNYPMLFLKTMAILVFAGFTFTSCKKDNDTPAPPTTIAIDGMYAGMYGFDNEPPANPEKYKIISGGTIQQISINNGSVVGNGTWLLNGNTFTATVTSIFTPYSKESISATFNSTTGKLNGTWGWDNSYTNGGKIELTKQ